MNHKILTIALVVLLTVGVAGAATTFTVDNSDLELGDTTSYDTDADNVYSLNEDVAVVDESTQTIEAVGTGEAIIRATGSTDYQEVLITVSEPEKSHIELDVPEYFDEIGEHIETGERVPYTVELHYTNGHVEDVTSDAHVSSDSDDLTVNTWQQELIVHDPGWYQVTASLSGKFVDGTNVTSVQSFESHDGDTETIETSDFEVEDSTIEFTGNSFPDVEESFESEDGDVETLEVPNEVEDETVTLTGVQKEVVWGDINEAKNFESGDVSAQEYRDYLYPEGGAGWYTLPESGDVYPSGGSGYVFDGDSANHDYIRFYTQGEDIIVAGTPGSDFTVTDEIYVEGDGSVTFVVDGEFSILNRVVGSALDPYETGGEFNVVSTGPIDMMSDSAFLGLAYSDSEIILEDDTGVEGAGVAPTYTGDFDSASSFDEDKFSASRTIPAEKTEDPTLLVDGQEIHSVTGELAGTSTTDVSLGEGTHNVNVEVGGSERVDWTYSADGPRTENPTVTKNGEIVAEHTGPLDDGQTSTIDTDHVEGDVDVSVDGSGQVDWTYETEGTTYLDESTDTLHASVEEPTIEYIYIEEPNNVETNETADFKAYRVWSSGQEERITQDSTWFSDNPSLAIMQGHVMNTFAEEGTVNISIEHGEDGQIYTNSTDVTVGPPPSDSPLGVFNLIDSTFVALLASIFVGLGITKGSERLRREKDRGDHTLIGIAGTFIGIFAANILGFVPFWTVIVSLIFGLAYSQDYF